MRRTRPLTALALVCSWASASHLAVSVVDKEGKPVQDAVVVLFPAN